MHNCEGESAPEAEDMKVGQGFLKHTIPFPWLVDVGVSDTGLSGTPLMSHFRCLASHWSVPVGFTVTLCTVLSLQFLLFP